MKNEDKGAFKVSISRRDLGMAVSGVPVANPSSTITFDGTGIKIEYDATHENQIGAFLNEARQMLPEALDAVARNRMVDELTETSHSTVRFSAPNINIGEGQGQEPEGPEPDSFHDCPFDYEEACSEHQLMKFDVFSCLVTGEYHLENEIERVASDIWEMMDGDFLRVFMILNELFRERPEVFTVGPNTVPVHAGVYLEIAKIKLRQLQALY